jgi:3-oxoacyl-[acyl-carrier protein] reductase
MKGVGPVFSLSGKVALVTGAGRNIGEGIAHGLAERGARVLVNDLVSERAAQVADDIADRGYLAAETAFDVTNPDQVSGPFLRSTPEQWKTLVELNLFGAMNCVSAVAPGMVERGWGRIIQISSLAGTIGTHVGVSIYGSAKAASESFIRNLAAELARGGVTANTLALGLMDNVGEELSAQLARTVPVGRLGTPRDVAAAVLYLASEESSWMTGQTIHLNGGTHMC